ncbi:flagellar basal body L-ring protein FlgH [Rhizobium sp. NRK18]|jgi:flagellar L-ring protein FlgH|uniref:flagellar basal body L-ring protein FlgH n=1 Tax=Rhizobium sp. NRK18 TaxID=2964667 RepID=UPI0021C310B5|nr:flagellar basal body L-ring protein FlgH [Rhizobium sp. NRK18]MCQ2005337.1 flagellar basal body L-ring protein FlgH [Rhizobium sp. NRK18]
MIKPIVALMACLSLASCGTKAFQEVNRAPAMSPVGSGLAYGQAPQQMVMYPQQTAPVAQGFSLWNDSQAALFKDARALKIGDILTVSITINDKASFDNSTSRSRTNSSGMNLSSAIDLFGKFQPADSNGDVKYGSDTSTDGKGTISRKEVLDLKVAAVVTGTLPNGNLIISGSQEVRVNQEMRILNVAGIVRPQDVDADNTISYERIAEARISYGGRGRLMEVQQPPMGQQLVDVYSPL